MFNTRYDDQYSKERNPLRTNPITYHYVKQGGNNMNSKYVDFGGKKYTIFYTHDIKAIRSVGMFDREPMQEIINTLTVIAVDGCEVKPMSLTWNNDNENIIDNVKKLLTSYITSPEHQPTQEQIFEQWDGDLDRYGNF